MPSIPFQAKSSPTNIFSDVWFWYWNLKNTTVRMIWWRFVMIQKWLYNIVMLIPQSLIYLIWHTYASFFPFCWYSNFANPKFNGNIFVAGIVGKWCPNKLFQPTFNGQLKFKNFPIKITFPNLSFFWWNFPQLSPQKKKQKKKFLLLGKFFFTIFH